jgi:ABC-type phosphate transport system substrate-binding protein
VASAATYGVGRAAVAYMQNMEKGNQLSGDELRKIFDAEAFAWKDRK